MDFIDSHGLILVAGNTTSDDYAPAASDHAYMFAVDLEGNWVWGNFFYNTSLALQTISGCTKAVSGNPLLLGMGNSLPVIMEVGMTQGEIIKFLSLEKIGTSPAQMPWYMTFSAIYEDPSDPQDGMKYYYASFIMDDRLILVKIDSDSGEVKYSYDYMLTISGQEWRNKKIPQLFMQDPTAANRMFLIGQFGQRASVMKFEKSTAQLDWILQIKHATGLAAPEAMMSEIYSYARSKKDEQWMFMCGYRWTSPSTEQFRQAAVMKMSINGEIQFLDVFNDTNNDQRDTCRAVAYDEDNDQVVYLFEVTQGPLRPKFSEYKDYSATNSDLLIVQMNPDGGYKGAININYAGASIDLFVGKHSFFTKNGDYYFGSYSWGFHTNFNNKSYTATDAFYDAHLFKYNPASAGDINCFH